MPLHYRTDWWGEVGIRPDTWESVRDGARKIREKLGIPAGFGLAVISGLADDVRVSSTSSGVSVRMSWRSAAPTA